MQNRSDLQGIICWNLAFLANLFLPFAVGRYYVTDDGMTGMIFAVATVWFVGLLACLYSVRVCEWLLIGSVITALSQICPVLHFVAGLIAIESWSQFAGIDHFDEWSDTGYHLPMLGGFLVTLWAAMPIATVALGLGFVAWLAFFREKVERHQSPGDWI